MRNLKRLDVFVVRFLPLLLFIYMIKIIIDSWHGISQYPFNLLHSNSFFYASALFLVSLSDSKYHCVWNRAMYIELMLVPILNYLDAKFVLFTDVYSALMVISVTIGMTVIATVVLAVRHFIRTNRRRISNGKDRRGETGL